MRRVFRGVGIPYQCICLSIRTTRPHLLYDLHPPQSSAASRHPSPTLSLSSSLFLSLPLTQTREGKGRDERRQKKYSWGRAREARGFTGDTMPVAHFLKGSMLPLRKPKAYLSIGASQGNGETECRMEDETVILSCCDNGAPVVTGTEECEGRRWWRRRRRAEE
ncbi:unnamed protein product [Pleuronectes platessa]|uniref:Uncharacterized protein n=1 Tax=Pleuronectes platessa TaxID=8262 RepID=A0A9N7U8X9_PLEPL|nr:unnamed protein product [Pleuronectes platessa]